MSTTIAAERQARSAAPLADAPDVTSPAFKANPYPFYARLRAEAPVYRVKAMTSIHRRDGWLVTRYDDVVSVLKDPRLVKNRRNTALPGERVKEPWVPGVFKPLAQNMLDQDAPDHTRLRALVHKGFTPRLVEQLRTRIQSLTEDLLDSAERKGSVDLVADYALPLPATIIADLLGVPASDRDKFHRWSSKIVNVTSHREVLGATFHIWQFVRYIRALIKQRRAEPRDDLITSLVQAEEAGDTLSEDELVAMIFLLLVAGHETTVNLIASGTLALIEHPDQLERLRQDPSLGKTAVGELLRFTSPVELATERFAREDLEVAGTGDPSGGGPSGAGAQPGAGRPAVVIPRGEMVLAVLGSANHDERQFPDPETLDLSRTPNQHVAFGQGAHYCLGAPLARLEGQIAFETLLRRAPSLRLAVPATSLRWRRALFLRGLERLPVAL